MKKKTFGYRVMVIGLMVSLIADPAWAMIMVTINPASVSMRKKTDGVNGHGTIMVMGDDVNNWNWRFGFGIKDPAGNWQPEREEAFMPNPASWGKALVAPPWSVSPVPPPPMIPIPFPDHFARVTREWALGLGFAPQIDETNMHMVLN